ncbi:probable sensor/response regulator hybrid [Photobacterium aphoticum]|uniref:histidine kinase n=1 Tax=Photobacterium aphoticum TaxID=754436 RepID=A0A090R6K2_9GAMM|nr:probable sensor/response regulator hybrid [Photobacterium aphoticum]
MDEEQRIALLMKKVARERAARTSAEKLLEIKSLELFDAKKLIEKSFEKVKAKAELDSELLAYQAKVESMLLEFGRKFLKDPPSAALIKELADSLVDNDSVRACGIVITSYPDNTLAIEHTSGRQQVWDCPVDLSQQHHYWDPVEKVLWISLDNHLNTQGFFATKLHATGNWLNTIQKHMHLFSEMLRSSIDRQLKLEEAIIARQRAEASEKSTRDFLAMINHELRTPLNGLLGTAELMADTALDAHQSRLLSTLNHSGELLRAIINDLLDYSKINAGMLELTHKPFDCHSMVNMLNDIFQHRANEKQLFFSIHCPEDTPRWMMGDQDRIKQIYVNLISNALKFTAKGAVNADIHWQEGELVFTVTDSGCGIPKDKQAQLFEPFTQVDNSSQRNHEGTGLGLAICKKLAQQMQGSISVDSDAGQGASFTVILPLSLYHVENKGKDNETNANKPIDNLSVLVVEDMKTNQMIISLMMSKFGITPTIANNGQEALNQLAKKPFDIVLMDCRMPIMDGYTATQTLRTQGYTKPILALTAGTTRAEREECYSAGMDDILSKPYQAHELREMLEKWGT